MEYFILGPINIQKLKKNILCLHIDLSQLVVSVPSDRSLSIWEWTEMRLAKIKRQQSAAPRSVWMWLFVVMRIQENVFERDAVITFVTNNLF